MGRFDGKVAIVTGGARGVGRSHAILLASEGAKVIVNDYGGGWDGVGQDPRPATQVAEEIRASGGQAVANHGDVADWQSGQDLIQLAIETYGRLDILVCNAGIIRDRTSFKMSEEEWDAVVRVHLKGHFVPTRFATAYWRERAKSTGQPVNGRIVYTASESGLFGNPGQLNYSAAKAGIIAMAIVVSSEMKKYGVTANTICPRARTRLAEGGLGAFKIEEGVFDAWHPDNIAPWVAYLCSDDAGHITGQTFVVSGGEIQLMQGWTKVNAINKDDRWTLDELTEASAELFGDRSTDTPTVSRDIIPTLPVGSHNGS
ncbi:MAG: SDR family NAD(P)-dependent oxidoreductase [Mycobacterium sp.]